LDAKLLFAISCGKAAARGSRMLGRPGSSLPGKVALKVYPWTLRDLAARAQQGTILVTGTNGKTTTNNMLARILQQAGARVICNREGANLITGVTTAFLRETTLFGQMEFDWAVLEVDEASFPGVAAQVDPRLVVVTNFFRDQLDRYGELDRTVAVIRDAVERLPETRLVLNADDPLVAQFGELGPSAVYYGLAPHARVVERRFRVREARFCPRCGGALHYAFYHYSQLGLFRCPNCGFRRPAPEVEGLQARYQGERVACTIRFGEKEFPLELPTQGFYNLYNALAAFAAGMTLGLEPGQVVPSLETYEPATGRLQRFRYRDKPVYLNLVKNPAGFNEALNLLYTNEGAKDVFIAVNDNAADGRDISWLWDVDFEVLEELQRDVAGFVCSGLRAEEMGVRLKYAGVQPAKILVEPDLKAAVHRTLKGNGAQAFFFATYTALWPVEKLLRTRVTPEGRGRDVGCRPSLP
jgi:UDP-N-acetylmuramyl tripeptide synthase